MANQVETNPRDLGDIGVSNEVFETIALTCTKKINGVSMMETADGLVDSLSKVWGRSDTPTGVKVITGEDDVVLEITVILEEGYPIPQIADTIQREVKAKTEDMTGHAVKAINILVADVKPRAVEPVLIPADDSGD